MNHDISLVRDDCDDRKTTGRRFLAEADEMVWRSLELSLLRDEAPGQLSPVIETQERSEAAATLLRCYTKARHVTEKSSEAGVEPLRIVESSSQGEAKWRKQ